MKNLIFILVLFALAFGPFWKTEYEKRWEERQSGKATASITPGGSTATAAPAPPPAPVETYTPKNGIDGKALFKSNCSACHYASEKRSTGPGLKGVLDRIPGGNWKYEWVRNSQKLVTSGDAYAVSKFKEFNNIPMSPFPQLKNEEIDEIFNYLGSLK